MHAATHVLDDWQGVFDCTGCGYALFARTGLKWLERRARTDGARGLIALRIDPTAKDPLRIDSSADRRCVLLRCWWMPVDASEMDDKWHGWLAADSDWPWIDERTNG